MKDTELDAVRLGTPMHGDSLDADECMLLKKACEDGCPRAISKLYEQESTFLRGYIAKRHPSIAAEAEDIVHLLFQRICEGRCNYSGKSSARTYLCAVARNLAQNHARTVRRRVKTVPLHGTGHRDHIEAWCRDPFSFVENSETQETVREAVLRLPRKSREAIELAYFQNAKGNAGNPGTSDVLRKRLSYAMTKLRRKLRAHSSSR